VTGRTPAALPYVPPQSPLTPYLKGLIALQDVVVCDNILY